jgi:hypothetical protein
LPATNLKKPAAASLLVDFTSPQWTMSASGIVTDMSLSVCARDRNTEVKRGPIEVHDFFLREGLARNARQRRRWETEILVLDSLGDEQMLVGVLMGDDGFPFRI